MGEHDDLQRRLRHLGTQPIDPGRQSSDLTAMAGVGRSSRRPGLLGSKVRLAGAFLAGLLIGSTGLAAADALPDPAQHVAHTVLARVGVDVPNPERYHGAECGSEVKKNHGAYVRDDHALAQSDCGKPVRGAGGGDDADDPDDDRAGNGKSTGGGSKGPCQGRPPWAGNEAMTEAEVAAAKAERAALCGTDPDDEADELEDDADEQEEDPASRAAEGGEPTTTTGPTTTTPAPTTTTEVTTTTVVAPTTSTTG